MRFVFLLVACAAALFGERQVAITIDDLPIAQSRGSGCGFDELRSFTSRLLKPLSDAKIPFTGFVIAGNCPELTDAQLGEVLKIWTRAGAELGNHTWSHKGLNTATSEEYERDILRADERLRRVLGKPVEFFRSPMLQTGPTPEAKQRLDHFLAAHGFRQAPVTFDNSDWMFAYVLLQARAKGDKELEQRVLREYLPYMESTFEFFESRAVEMTGREFPQVLLIHANQLNLEMLPKLLDVFRRRGYKFVSLREALKDPVYSMPNNYAGRGGFSWIHRWTMSMEKQLPKRAEPDEPKWLQQAYQP